MSELTFVEVSRLLIGSDWIFAKTMKSNPHWYTRRRNWPDERLFVMVVEYIRAHGYQQSWPAGKPWAKTYTYLDVADHQYWTMGADLDRTILINRKPLPPGTAPRPPA